MNLRSFYFKMRYYSRWLSLKLRKVNVGKDVYIEPRVFLSNSIIGDYTYIGHNCVIDKTVIGNYCSIAAFAQIGGLEHSHWWWSTSPRLSSLGRKNTTKIGHDVWIGSKVSLREGINIGNGAVIGSNAVVLNDVEPYSIVAGIPAKVIKMRFTRDQIDRLEETRYYEKDPESAKSILNLLKMEV